MPFYLVNDICRWWHYFIVCAQKILKKSAAHIGHLLPTVRKIFLALRFKGQRTIRVEQVWLLIEKNQ